MAVDRIERIVGGKIIQRAERGQSGLYTCLPFGTNMGTIRFSTLGEVADYLRSNPGSGVRMNPGYSKISENVFIDGRPR